MPSTSDLFAILYARYSPRPHESESVESQLEEMRRWATEHGYTVVGEFWDKDVSGTIPLLEREGLASAFRALKPGYALVVRNVDRAARGPEVALVIESELARIGAHLCAIEQGGRQATKYEDPSAWGMRMFHYIFAEIKRIEGNRRTSRKMRSAQDAGRRMSKEPPFGFHASGGYLLADPGEQRTLEDIKRWHAQGFGPGSIATRLEAAGVPCRGKRWHKQTVRRILARYQRSKNGG